MSVNKPQPFRRLMNFQAGVKALIAAGLSAVAALIQMPEYESRGHGEGAWGSRRQARQNKAKHLRLMSAARKRREKKAKANSRSARQ